MLNFFTISLNLINISVILVSVGLIALTFLYQKKRHTKYGYIFGYYPWEYKLFLDPLYEEVLFRGVILAVLYGLFGYVSAVAVSSLLFGLWHLRNLRHQPNSVTFWQVVYTGFVLGPLLAYITLAVGHIYIAVLLHSLNNLLAPISQKLLKSSYPH